MMLGWMHYERGVPKDKLTLEALVPSGERDGVKVFFDYSQVRLSVDQCLVQLACGCHGVLDAGAPGRRVQHMHHNTGCTHHTHDSGSPTSDRSAYSR